MTPLLSLALAVIAFVGTHFLLSHPLRAPLVARVGESGFLGLYSVVALVTFGWIVWARLHVGDADILWWIAPPGAWDAATLVMLLDAILLAGSMRNNPAMPNASGRTPAIAPPRGVFAITRHPMLWSFAIWAIVHMALWGTAANLLVCAGVLILSLGGAAAQDAKKRRLLGKTWRDWQAHTAFVPFAAQVSGRIGWAAALPGWRATIIGALLWLAATWAHAPAGGPIAGPWRWIG